MALNTLRVLAVDDDVDVLTALRILLKKHVKEIVVEKNPNNIQALLKSSKFDVVILDMNFNGMIHTGNEGLYWLGKIKECDPACAVILITAFGDIDLAIKSLKRGASDFVVKPWSNDKLLDAIAEVNQKKREKEKTRKSTSYHSGIIGKSSTLQAVLFKADKVAPTNANVLLLGENGTGKDVLAQYIHEHSNRKEKPFIKVDVGALSPSLFESELFGYKKGAFTDAKEDRKGRFEIASGGTLFLDEIGNISLQQQAVLLSALQSRTITPIGSTAAVETDLRLICATNLSMQDLADESKFRKDLIYRINTVEILLPPLRERAEDKVILAEHFLKIYGDQYSKDELMMDKSFIDKIKSYHYPGNVREMQYAIERAVIMTDNQTLTAEDLIFSPIEKNQFREEESDNKLDQMEKKTILMVIEKNNGNITKSAKELGITRTALYRRLAKYGL